MKKNLAVLALLVCASAPAWGQTPAASAPAAAQGEIPEVTANYALGTVLSVDAANKQVVLSTKSAGAIIVQVTDATVYKKVPPGEKSLANATTVTLAEVGVGDRIMARGVVAGNSVPARQIIVMNKAEIAKKNDSERIDWQQRGIVGVVSGLNTQTQEITLTLRRPEGPQNIVLPTAQGNVKFRRYTPDVVRFADAKPSNFNEIKMGDQLRALGTRSTDGARYTPEQVVFGSFQTVIGKIVSIDATKNEIVVNNEQAKQTITFTVKPESVLKRAPDMSGMMGMMGGGGGMRPPGQGGPGGQRPEGQAGAGPGQGGQRPDGPRPDGQGGQRQGGGPGGPGGQGRGPMGGFDVQSFIERMPETTLAELKPGESIVIAGNKGDNPVRMTATTLVANMDFILSMMARRAGGGPGAGGGAAGGGGAPSFDLGLGLP